jgi:hypothetical protein
VLCAELGRMFRQLLLSWLADDRTEDQAGPEGEGLAGRDLLMRASKLGHKSANTGP